MILVPVAAGELIDKITILEVRRDRLQDPAQRVAVERELAALRAVAEDVLGGTEVHVGLQANLKAVNTLLWDIEDGGRRHEAEQRFDEEFIQLARHAYIFSDRRAAIKREIDLLLGADVLQEGRQAAPAHAVSVGVR